MAEGLLLLEDRENLRALLARTLARHFDVDAVGTLSEATALLTTRRYAVIVSDVRLPDGLGTELLDRRAELPAPPPELILMTAYGEIPSAVDALRRGAYDYLPKPFEPEHLERVVGHAAERWALLERSRLLEAELAPRDHALVGASPGIVNARRLIDKVATSPVSVAVRGEPGTGKQLFASELHRASGRVAWRTLHVGTAAPETIEPLLFDATHGLLRGNTPATLYLDEVERLPPAVQVRLAAWLDGDDRQGADVRIVAATTEDLDAAVRAGTFRAELAWPLRVVQPLLPPLRERRDDLPLLVARLLPAAAVHLRARARRVSPDALAALQAHAWPGNVRELRHALEHAAVMAQGEVIEVGDLPENIERTAPRGAPGSYREAVDQARDDAGRAYLRDLLRRHAGNVTHAATDAGVERETLHRLLRKHDLDAARFRDS